MNVKPIMMEKGVMLITVVELLPSSSWHNFWFSFWSGLPITGVHADAHDETTNACGRGGLT